jgi:CDP-diacylglycerol--glycerol-3-phosphate 3-phosphatidyltransferase
VGFLERPERVVLIIIGALFDRMAPVLWLIVFFSNMPVLHRVIHTYREAHRMEAGANGAAQDKELSRNPATPVAQP